MPLTSDARRMIEYIDASPSPYHACSEAALRLEQAGFARLEELAHWDLGAGSFFVVRSGALVAWTASEGHKPTAGFRVIGAHTDSPNLRVKPQPDTGSVRYRQLGVEVYGGVLLNSWLDRDLGLSGRAFVRGPEGPEERQFLVQRPILRLPQLAIHLDREINTKGLLLNKQRHMSPIWGLKRTDAAGFRAFLAGELGVEEDAIMSWEAMCHDITPSCIGGVDEEFVSAPRLDNQSSCFTGLQALIQHAQSSAASEFIPVLALFDHEEVGSGSRGGADSPLLGGLLERSVLARGGNREDYLRAIADSVCVSSDMAHATHPNYVDRHEPDHRIHMNAGPVIKINANQRYATEAETEALFQHACERAEVPVQKFVGRTDLGCGSTIGPVTAAKLGMRTVDVGNPQLAMHSAREMCGSHDTGYLIRALEQFLQ